jgi:pentatricopeptide repeat protein
MERKHLDNDARGYHSYHWLLYGYLQQGRVAEAREMVFKMQQYAKEKPSKRARVHVVLLKGTWLVETQEWDDSVASIAVEVSDLNIGARSQYSFLEGMKAYSHRNAEKLAGAIAAIGKDIAVESEIAKDEGASFCMGATREAASRMDIEQSRIMKSELRALHAVLIDDPVQAESWLMKAVALEDSISYDYGPPTVQKPTRELYGEWLLEQGRPEEALQQFEAALKRAPGRVLAEKGKKTAVEAMEEGNGAIAGRKK